MEKGRVHGTDEKELGASDQQRCFLVKEIQTCFCSLQPKTPSLIHSTLANHLETRAQCAHIIGFLGASPSMDKRAWVPSPAQQSLKSEQCEKKKKE